MYNLTVRQHNELTRLLVFAVISDKKLCRDGAAFNPRGPDGTRSDCLGESLAILQALYQGGLRGEHESEHGIALARESVDLLDRALLAMVTP